MSAQDRGQHCDVFRQEGIVQHFLAGKHLRQMFAHLCNNTSGQAVDPISDVAYIMITSPVQMMITDVSVNMWHERVRQIYLTPHNKPARPRHKRVHNNVPDPTLS